VRGEAQPTVRETVKQAAVMAYSLRPFGKVQHGGLRGVRTQARFLLVVPPCHVGAARFDFLVTVGRVKGTGKGTVMSSQADFKDEVTRFEEVERKPLDLKRLQSAMFLDRPDLWPVIRRKKKSSALPGQPSFFKVDT
jgi:hypothetical protein